MNSFITIVSDRSKFQNLKAKNTFIAKINGERCKTSNDLFRELKNEFELPDYFGKNLDALYDCLMDMEWIAQDHIRIVIDAFDLLLSNEENDPELIEDFIITLDDICQSWDLLDNEETTPKSFQVFIFDSETAKEILNLNGISFDII
ncbi:MAG: barstar family protein [Saprospiraceae bacterium]|nr:barstar family protein [Saprospiraceae bacterium]MBK8449197.1 barstar family protein [Saprospiraceae bacterium]MBK8484724.1 barstar family protein [Saprospiraceae bacterium]MBK9222150.1 barstar family protein [Saprospiraceae bacterium]MBK9720940.1 barstar family protein [Saprospiraceae bacterium]